MPAELVLPRQRWAPPAKRALVPPDHQGMPVQIDTVIRDADTNEIVLAQLPVLDNDRLEWLARYIRMRLDWDDDNGNGTSQARLSGIRYGSRVFGFTAPAPLRKRYGAGSALMAKTDPELWENLVQLTRELWWLPSANGLAEPLARHTRLVNAKIHPDWRFGDTPFTSGIINRSASLPYHRDSGNLVGTWSMMLCLRNHVLGGRLHVPEYDVTLDVPDASLILFNGQQLWHGVTPMRVGRRGGYRYTLVWYAKSGLASCGPAEAEAKRAAARATELLDQRYRRPS